MTLTFANGLTVSRWSWHNEYCYYEISNSGIYFIPDKEKLYILTQEHSHPIKDGVQELYWDIATPQFNQRIPTTIKIKDILNSARTPMKITIDRDYIIGKGFMAAYNDGDIDILFAATCVGKVTSPNELKLYKSRNVDLPIHKKIKGAIDKTIAEHGGDVIVTNNLNKYIGATISLPPTKTISEAATRDKQLVSECLDELFKTVVVKPLEKLPVTSNTMITSGTVSAAAYSASSILEEDEEEEYDDYEDDYDEYSDED